jgi:hypothetical protein
LSFKQKILIKKVRQAKKQIEQFNLSIFTPLEIMPRCSAAGLDFRIIPAEFNGPLEFLTGFTPVMGAIAML